MRAELINKQEELENQKKNMIKNNISLLKQRATEVTIFLLFENKIFLIFYTKARHKRS